MRALSRLWPRTLARQLSLLLLLALLASNAIAMLVLQRTGSLIHPLSRSFSLERLGTAHHAAVDLPPAETAHLLAAMGSAGARFWMASTPEVAPFELRPEEQRLANELRSRLHLNEALAIGVQLERISGANARTHLFSPAGWAPLRLRSSIALPNGSYLNAVQFPAGAYEWGRVLAYSLPVTTLPVLLIVMFFIARVVRPIKTLAQATERVSRGEWIAPLPEQGPQEARELTVAFNAMQAHLARHVEGRTRMLAAVSHDLNTPITELRLQVELLEPGAARDDMLESLSELSAMVRETLNFVRDDAVQEHTTTISLSALLDDLAKRYQRLQQPVTWAGAPPLQVTCRPLALKRALTNLIDNALHHAGDASLHLLREHGGWLRIEILDHGQGLPEDWLNKVFEPFVQRGVSDGGVGLGLAIARSCIQAHGGELVLENRAPAGLCAVVRLPAAL
ncbi:Signal transduction histidine kinase [Pseudomonas cedrina]|uniref:histidine kinase n=1 Tax=Pseudomonas cedrina TaxID=651740 RepID=A0ABY0UEI2_PSECE|nr:Signal transduction histidine kinase [Pseudomonas cedrina]